MIYENALKKHRILIKEVKEGRIIADTKIIRYDSSRNAVVIDAGSLQKIKPYNVNVLIFGDDKLYEFCGTITGIMTNNEIEVLLGKSREKEDRKRARYAVTMNGFVKVIKIKNQNITLRKPIVFVTVNMSSNGILLKTGTGTFFVGCRFQMLLEMEGKNMEFDCEVIRIQNSTPKTEEYGCKIHATRKI